MDLPSCEIGDVAKCRAIMEEYGCVVFKGVASDAELEAGERHLWDWLEGLGLGIKRDDLATHTTRGVWDQLNGDKSARNGVVGRFSVGHSEAMWHCRQLPGVLSAAATIWKAKMEAGEVIQRWTPPALTIRPSELKLDAVLSYIGREGKVPSGREEKAGGLTRVERAKAASGKTVREALDLRYNHYSSAGHVQTKKPYLRVDIAYDINRHLLAIKPPPTQSNPAKATTNAKAEVKVRSDRDKDFDESDGNSSNRDFESGGAKSKHDPAVLSENAPSKEWLKQCESFSITEASTSLLPSFDGFGAYRNPFTPHADESWRTRHNWFHLDQDWSGDAAHPYFHRVQGLLNFYDTTSAGGSTVVVMGSHR